MIHILFLFLLVAVDLKTAHSGITHVAVDADDDHETSAPRTYIVRMQEPLQPMSRASQLASYASKLAAATGSSTESKANSIIHVYTVVLHGFAAKMTSTQAKAMEAIPGTVSVFPDTMRQLHTTHSPEFLHLNSSWGLWPRSQYGSDVIVGILDTGIWAESKSFIDDKFGPVPSRWKGKCISGPGFNASHLCNRKLIGAHAFYQGYEARNGAMNETVEYKSPLDSEGHGTHTASTATGQFVSDASLLGSAEGTAVGMAPNARVAVYKVCWLKGCFNSDILAGFDQALADGVDVISLSVGGKPAQYFEDGIALGAFAAMEKGVFVACSAGNEGPNDLSVTNVAPWITTVGASSMDRTFPADVILSDGSTYKGTQSLCNTAAGAGQVGKELPLIYASDAALPTNDRSSSQGQEASAGQCLPGSIDPKLVRGKLVVCDRGSNGRVEKGEVVMAAGGAGMILANTEKDGEGLIADCHVLPAAMVGAAAGNKIRSLAQSNKNARGMIHFYGTRVGSSPAPVVASFSSRGPNMETPKILKPDVIAPGVNILAAWTGLSSPSEIPGDSRRVPFNIISGTSMACPHVSGLAALLKAAHPEWSPSAIKSALMTTAYLLDNKAHPISDEATGKASTPFDFGAGHVDPQKALDPGLIYDLGRQEYINFLCSLNYSENEIGMITRKPFSCPNASVHVEDLNYPSFSALLDPQFSSTSFARTVTNVGQPNSIYLATVSSPSNVDIVVEPSKLAFTKINQKMSFKVTVRAKNISTSARGDFQKMFGLLSWTDGTHIVQSPIAIVLHGA